MLTRDERGAATAEFAVVLPAVIVVILIAVGALSAVGTQVRLEQAAAQAARLHARGDDPARISAVVDEIVAGAGWSAVAEGDLVCVRTVATAPMPLPTLAARSCALREVR